MLIFLDAVTATGIIFALGHFYFSLVYDAKKYGVRNTGALMAVSLVITAIWYAGLQGFSSPTRVTFFATSVLFVFMLHNFYDLWRFGYRVVGVIALVTGLVLLYLFFWYRSDNFYGIVASLGIWFLVFSHYLFWIFISIRRFDAAESEKFIRDTVAIHIAIAAGYMASAAANVRAADVMYSLPFFFYPITLIHVVFSALRQFLKLRSAKITQLRSAGEVV